jgi:hypothetical protein
MTAQARGDGARGVMTAPAAPSTPLDEEVLARVFERLDLNGLRELQLELWIAFEDRGLGGSRQECRAMANAVVERGLRYFADRVVRYVDLPVVDEPREALEQLRDVMATRSSPRV